ncbi:fatty acid desaturase-domain-containing protein [Halteromyces radiatus]|uniref:fatty acid desaturase-domain-containing protein n=1 Tax=Halteromyces radiatus TaxID=101107 RepID=UPI00221EAFF9|nr:fatty acid desaturase-domain-containing protein [Halteromyces radiatus]KAI8099576.1 fatty acid desaturase-domain-containing protein [Halteromyces radiatus]
MPPFVESEVKENNHFQVNKRTTSDQVEEKHPDYRAPLYLGGWKRSIPGRDSDFAQDDMDEPHLKRKHTILRAHPQVEKLYGTDIRTFYVTVVINIVQLGLAYYFGHHVWSWWQYLLTGYVVGGTLTAMLGVVIHEACHCLIFRCKSWNRYAGLFANICLPVPIAQSFRRYHIEHHTWQGVDGMDPDLPLDWEKNLIKGNALTKLLWILIYPVMYVVRGAVMQKDRNLTPSKWEIINIIFTIISDYLIYRVCGTYGLLYLLMSLWFGYSLHPGAAHFIQEHYTFVDGQETYSYYGILNVPFMNIGYHNEHHDFQKIPWSQLPALKSLADEYYDKLSYHTSWIMVHWKFITQSTIGPQSRVIRDYGTFKWGRSLLGKIKLYEEKHPYHD